MSYNLFLDDIREVSWVYKKVDLTSFITVRKYEEFVAVIKNKGLPIFISFDNDLGENEFGELEPDGYAAAKWLVYNSGLDLKGLIYKVHSANPVASNQIKGLLDNYVKFLKNGGEVYSCKI